MVSNEYSESSLLSTTSNMSDIELKNFSRLIYDQSGIALSPAKKSMLCARLAKRLRVLSIDSFKDYYKFVMESLNKNDELTHLLDVVTTNTTHFFRESEHFRHLESTVLSQLFSKTDTVKIWSAGCSSGEEPYTVAMVLKEYTEKNGGDFSILATDLSTKVLRKAMAAVYDDESVEKVPNLMKRKYMMCGKGEKAGMWRIVPELRKKITFAHLNFMDQEYDIDDSFDIIFCRNVIIYFDWDTKAKLIQRFHDHLIPGGYLFIGHSETLNGLNDQFRSVAPTLYRKPLTGAGRLAA